MWISINILPSLTAAGSYMSWLYSVWFQSVVLITKLLFIAFVIAFCMVSVCCTDRQAAVHCILYDFNLWYDHQAAVSSWSYSVWFQSVVLITKLPFIDLMIIFCVISVCCTDHQAAIRCPHDHILCDFSLWYWSPCCHSLPSWLYSVWFQSVVLITKLPFIALFSQLVSIVAPEYFDNGEPSLEAGT